ncbi:MAG: hypothetical protein QXO32_00020 [Candidatus Bathyarchaeia archaeon]
MVTKIVTKFSIVKKYGKNKAVYKSPRIYLPTKLTEDSAFPLKEGDHIQVKIVGKKLMVEKIKTKSKKSKQLRKFNKSNP